MDEPGNVRGVGEITKSLVRNLSDLARAEARQAVLEIQYELRKLVVVGGLLATAAFALFFVLVLGSVAAAQGLAELMHPALAYLVVTVVWALVAVVCVLIALPRVRGLAPVPTRTIESVKEDITWIKNRS